MKKVNRSEQIWKPRRSLFDELSLEFGSWARPWSHPATFLGPQLGKIRKYAPNDVKMEALGFLWEYLGPSLGSFWSPGGPHEGHFGIFRPAVKPQSMENVHFVILMPLSSEITTFEGLGSCQVGSGGASKCCLEKLARAHESHDSKGDIFNRTFE